GGNPQTARSQVALALLAAQLTLSALFVCPTTIHAQQQRLRAYGYFDLETEISNKNSAGKRWTFDQHHFNVITIYRVDDRTRVFSEIEWEHGVELSTDPAVSSGLVALERAWLEYSSSQTFRVKAGKFLVPFGIFNLEHDASPTYLSTSLPGSVYGKRRNTVGSNQRLFSKFGTGLQVLGEFGFSAGDLAYYLYLVNGRGPEPHKQDNNSNKGIGGRLYFSGSLDLYRIGLSYYGDRNGVADDTRQRSLAFDAELNYHGFKLQTELILPEMENVSLSGFPDGSFRSSAGFYAQGSFEVSDKITPFGRYEFFDPDRDTGNNRENIFVLGLNASLTHHLYLKAEGHLHRLQNPGVRGYERFVSSVAVAF
ncbi:MAG: hypothetical protein ACE5GA_10410, partial [Candidatus Zixiibacteriota bacterium]